MCSRRKKSSGQAIVMVTLALFVMCGMLGLAVDLGWSFFVKKQAQAAADAAALGVVNEAIARNSGSQGLACGVRNVFCSATNTTRENCGGMSTASNLWNGCEYAKANGFNFTAPQAVTVTAGTGLPPTVTGINSKAIAYWATVRTVQTIPQLFSAVLGNTTGTISAISTAAVVGTIVNASFVALNQPGDCMLDHTGKQECGVDVDIQGAGSKACAGQTALGNNTLCAGGGIELSSTCDGTTQAGCSSQNNALLPYGSTNSFTKTGTDFAGQSGGGASVGGPFTQVTASGTLQQPSVWPSVQTGGSGTDPFESKFQPPLATSNQAMPCGIPQGTHLTGNLGPFNYYSYSSIGVNGPVPASAPIIVDNGATFAANGTCPGFVSPSDFASYANAQAGSQFPAYFFWGGLNVAGSATFGAGQYVSVGTGSQTGSSLAFTASSATVTGDSATGTMFLTTAPGYPGLSSQLTPTVLQGAQNANQFQGNISLAAGNSTTITLTGVKMDSGALPSQFGDYNGFLMWQDRRNSGSVEYNQSTTFGNTYGSAGACSSCSDTQLPGKIINPQITAAEYAANHVTATSPGFNFQAGPNFNTNGVIYMPRGSWFTYQGGAGTQANISIITGGINMSGGGQLSLTAVSNPAIVYTVALIQ
jgi:Flp pilus assembly protein TadG